MVSSDEVPDNWGLLYERSGAIIVEKEAKEQEANNRAENAILCSIMRREGIKAQVFNYRKQETMKRQIKFRGKCTDTGAWIYGDLLTSNGTECEISDWNDVVYSRYDVDPDTIGQFTELLDKNGKEIYEGDVLSFITERKMGFRKDGVEILFSVVFGRANPDNDTTSEYIGFWAESESGCRSSIAYRIRSNGAKVIGNIQDNNELLKGGKG